MQKHKTVHTHQGASDKATKSKIPKQHVGRRDDYTLFFERHKPIQNKLDYNACFGGTMFETYGPELEQVKKQDYHNVFTYVDYDGKSYASPGFHWFNRLGYFIVEIPWTDEQGRTYRL